MKAFQANLSRLEAADTQVLGVSMDSPFSNFQFAQQNGVTFPLLGDFGGEATRAYGLEKDYDIQGVRSVGQKASLQITTSDRVSPTPNGFPWTFQVRTCRRPWSRMA